MKIQNAIQSVFTQLSNSLHQLSNEEYTQKCPTLFNATIGQHVRHIIELFICLEQGYEKGVINYEKRKRDYAIETEKEIAIMLLGKVLSGFHSRDKNLLLEATYNEHSEF